MVFRRVISLSLLAVFLLHTLSKVFVHAEYLLHRDFIAKNLCENRDDARLHCNGQCHLRKQLEKQDEKEQTPVSPGDEKREIQLFSQQVECPNIFSGVIVHMVSQYYVTSLSEEHLHAVFHPPTV